MPLPSPNSAFKPPAPPSRAPGAFAPVFTSHRHSASDPSPFAPLHAPQTAPPPAAKPPPPTTRTRTTFAGATTDLLRVYEAVNPSFAFRDDVPRRCLTDPSEIVGNVVDNERNDYVLHVNDVLLDADAGDEYVVLDLLGTGTFGQVAKCLHKSSATVVAVKIVKSQTAYYQQAWVEISILMMLHSRMSEQEKRSVVEYRRHFVLHGHLCIVFEKLSINLFELLRQNRYMGVNMTMLRSFLRQLLQALAVLVKTDIIHCDVKPENILLTSQADITDLKLIDFGSACQVQHHVYSYVQSRFYRSPEVLLGAAKYDTKIDMWSLGCVAGELFLGVPLFAGQNAMNMLCRIDEMLGPFPDMFLRSCRDTTKFFNDACGAAPLSAGDEEDDGSDDSEDDDGMVTGGDFAAFRLKTVREFEAENNTQLEEWKRYFKDRKLQDVIFNAASRAPPANAFGALEDFALRESFLDMLRGMLQIDPAARWTPEEALAHPFITEGPLPNGEPWVPRSRAHNIRHQAIPVPGTRPVKIDSRSRAAAMSDIMYSASAPSCAGAGGPFAPTQHSAQHDQLDQNFHMFQPHRHGLQTGQVHQQSQQHHDQGVSPFSSMAFGAGSSSFDQGVGAPHSLVPSSAFPAFHHAHSFSYSSPTHVRSQSPAPFGAEGATHPTSISQQEHQHIRIPDAAPMGVPSSNTFSHAHDSSPDIAVMSSSMSTHMDTDLGPGTWSDNDDTMSAPAMPAEGALGQSPFTGMGSAARPPLHTSPRLHAQHQTGQPK